MVADAASKRDVCRERKGGIRTSCEIPQVTAISAEGGAKPGAVAAEIQSIDPDLACLINAWPDLPPAIRRAVLALIGSAQA
jgi:hypothetical protein